MNVNPVGVKRDASLPALLSSMVTSTRSMSDFSQTVSWDRLPHSIAASTERSRFHLLHQRLQRRPEPLRHCALYSPLAHVCSRDYTSGGARPARPGFNSTPIARSSPAWAALAVPSPPSEQRASEAVNNLRSPILKSRDCKGAVFDAKSTAPSEAVNNLRSPILKGPDCKGAVFDAKRRRSLKASGPHPSTALSSIAAPPSDRSAMPAAPEYTPPRPPPRSAIHPSR